MTSTPTTTFGRYEVKRVLGHGSQGKVYLAFDPELQRQVAIKVVTSSRAEFNQTGDNGTPLEALVSSKLRHPNIVPIHDIGTSELGPHLVFGFVDGKPMATELVARHHFEMEEAVVMMAAILDAVAAAHATGVLHLDLGPRNIMLDENGKPQIMDFGLAQFVNFEREDLSLATGTLRYMAPEHFLRQDLGPFTDVFALASTFYEMLLGERAIPGENVEAIQRNIVSVAVDYQKLAKLKHGEHLVRFLKGAFVMDTEARYQDGGAMREAFNLFVTAAGLADAVRVDSPSHSTIDFLLRRMQHKQDFPAISSTLTDINKLTGDEGGGSADKLANVILRDLSLTSKLLKMANSSFYGSRATEVASVSQAVVLLGVQQIRMVASSLTLFGHLKGDSDVLKDSMSKSFLSGLIARHMAKREKMRNAEEAFIAGMCQNLGENLAIFYFDEEHEIILRQQREDGIDRDKAATDVLGVTFATLGSAVAQIWALPSSITDAIDGIADDTQLAPTNDDERLRNLSVLANELCNVFFNADPSMFTERLDALCERFRPTTDMSPIYTFKLFNAAFEKLKQFAPIFEINVGDSVFLNSVNQWLTAREREIEIEEKAAAASDTQAAAGAR
ncbi:MAG: HDOD domain-containing protein [Pseudomonadota bacterium]